MSDGVSCIKIQKDVSHRGARAKVVPTYALIERPAVFDVSHFTLKENLLANLDNSLLARV